MQQQCDFAALGERLVRYRLPMQTLERYLQQKHLFSKAIEFIFRQESVEAEPRHRLNSALEVIFKFTSQLFKDVMRPTYFAAPEFSYLHFFLISVTD